MNIYARLSQKIQPPVSVVGLKMLHNAEKIRIRQLSSTIWIGRFQNIIPSSLTALIFSHFYSLCLLALNPHKFFLLQNSTNSQSKNRSIMIKKSAPQLWIKQVSPNPTVSSLSLNGGTSGQSSPMNSVTMSISITSKFAMLMNSVTKVFGKAGIVTLNCGSMTIICCASIILQR